MVLSPVLEVIPTTRAAHPSQARRRPLTITTTTRRDRHQVRRTQMPPTSMVAPSLRLRKRPLARGPPSPVATVEGARSVHALESLPRLAPDLETHRYDAAATVRPTASAPTAERQATSASFSPSLRVDPRPLCPSQLSPAVYLQEHLCMVLSANHWHQARHLGLEERSHRPLAVRPTLDHRDIHPRDTVRSRLEARTTHLPPRTSTDGGGPTKKTMPRACHLPCTETLILTDARPRLQATATRVTPRRSTTTTRRTLRVSTCPRGTEPAPHAATARTHRSRGETEMGR